VDDGSEDALDPDANDRELTSIIGGARLISIPTPTTFPLQDTSTVVPSLDRFFKAQSGRVRRTRRCQASGPWLSPERAMGQLNPDTGCPAGRGHSWPQICRSDSPHPVNLPPPAPRPISEECCTHAPLRVTEIRRWVVDQAAPHDDVGLLILDRFPCPQDTLAAETAALGDPLRALVV
jgi:hypothetical protein